MRLAVLLICGAIAFGQSTLPSSEPKAGPSDYVRLSEILVVPKNVTTAPQAAASPAAPASSAHNSPSAVGEDAALAAAEAKANDLLNKIRDGASFEDIAKKFSDGPTAAYGGAIGQFKRGQLARVLEDKVFAMKVGDVSDVIRTKQGFTILKVTGGSAAATPQSSGGSIEVVSDTLGVDFGPYLQRVHDVIERHWKAVLPPSVFPPVLKKGRLLIQFSIMKDGSVQKMSLVAASGATDLDRAAWGGIVGSSPLPSLPDEFIRAGGTDLALRCWFRYNLDK